MSEIKVHERLAAIETILTGQSKDITDIKDTVKNAVPWKVAAVLGGIALIFSGAVWKKAETNAADIVMLKVSYGKYLDITEESKRCPVKEKKAVMARAVVRNDRRGGAGPHYLR